MKIHIIKDFLATGDTPKAEQGDLSEGALGARQAHAQAERKAAPQVKTKAAAHSVEDSTPALRDGMSEPALNQTEPAMLAEAGAHLAPEEAQLFLEQPDPGRMGRAPGTPIRGPQRTWQLPGTVRKSEVSTPPPALRGVQVAFGRPVALPARQGAAVVVPLLPEDTVDLASAAYDALTAAEPCDNHRAYLKRINELLYHYPCARGFYLQGQVLLRLKQDEQAQQSFCRALLSAEACSVEAGKWRALARQAYLSGRRRRQQRQGRSERIQMVFAQLRGNYVAQLVLADMLTGGDPALQAPPEQDSAHQATSLPDDRLAALRHAAQQAAHPKQAAQQAAATPQQARAASRIAAGALAFFAWRRRRGMAHPHMASSTLGG